MPQVLYKWWLPAKPWAGKNAKPYLSSWHMDAESAAKLGATEFDPTTRKEIPDDAGSDAWKHRTTQGSNKGE
jgi:hypothetical protein